MKPSKKLVKIIFLALAALFIVLTPCAYFVLSSSYFINGFILPFVSKKAGFEIKTDQLSLSLLRSRLEVKNLKATSSSKEEIFSADSLNVSWSSLALVKGSIAVDELKLENPKLTIIEKDNGGFSVAGLPETSASAKAETSEEKKKTAFSIPSVSLKNVELKNLSLNLLMKNKQDSFTVEKLNLSIPELSTDAKGSLKLEAALKGCFSEISLDSANLSLSAETLFSSARLPESVSATININGISGTIKEHRFSDRSINAVLDIAVKNGIYEIRKCSVTELEEANPGLSLDLQGTYNAASNAFDLSSKLDLKSYELLYAIGKSSGFADINSGSLSYAGTVSGKDGLYNAEASLSINDLTLSGNGERIAQDKAISVRTDYKLNFNAKKSLLDISSLKSVMKSGGRDFLTVDVQNVLRDQNSIQIEKMLMNLDLDLKLLNICPFMKNMHVNKGLLAGTVQVKNMDGKAFEADLNISSNNLNLTVENETVSGVNLDLNSSAAMSESGECKLDKLALTLDRTDKRILALRSSGKFAANFKKGDLLCQIQTLSPEICNLIPGSLARSMNAETLKALSGVNASANLDLSYDLSGDNTLRKMDIAINNGKENYNITLTEPCSLSIDKKLKQKTPLKLAVNGTLFDISWASQLIPQESGFKLVSGKLTSKLNLELDNNFQNLSLIGTSGISSLAFNSSDIAVSGAGGMLNLEVKANPEKIEIGACKGFATIKETKAIDFDIRGDIDLKKSQYMLHVGKLSLTENIAELLPEKIKKTQGAAIKAMAPFFFQMRGEFDIKQKDSLARIQTFSSELYFDKAQAASIVLNNPLTVNWKDTQNPCDNLELTANFNAFKLERLNGFTAASGLIFNFGSLGGNIICTVKNSGKLISANGNTILEALSLNYAGKNYNNIGIANTFDLEISEKNNIKIKSLRTLLTGRGREALKAEINGALNNADKSMSFDVSLTEFNENLLAMLPADTAASIPVKTVSLSGKAHYEKNASLFAANGQFNISRLSSSAVNGTKYQALNGSLTFDVSNTEKQFEIKKTSFSLSEKSRLLAHLDARAVIPNPWTSGQSKVLISSNALDLQALQEMFTPEKPLVKPVASSGSKEPAPTQNQSGSKEPAPLKLDGMNLAGALKLNNVTYGPNINISCDSRFTINGNLIKANPWYFTINGVPAGGNIEVDAGKADGYLYSINGETANFSLPPVLEAVSTGAFANSKGTIDSLKFDFKGKGFTQPNLTKYLNGTFSSKYSGISIPSQIYSNPIVAVILLPVELFANIQSIFPNQQFSSDFTKASSSSKNLLSEMKNIEFTTGELNLTAKNGYVHIDKCLFKGPLITSLSSTGTVWMDQRLDINTTVSIQKFEVPVKIGGTIQKPDYDKQAIIQDVLKQNAAALLNPENVLNIIKGDSSGTTGNTGTDNVIKDTEKTIRNIIDQFKR